MHLVCTLLKLSEVLKRGWRTEGVGSRKSSHARNLRGVFCVPLLLFTPLGPTEDTILGKISCCILGPLIPLTPFPNLWNGGVSPFFGKGPDRVPPDPFGIVPCESLKKEEKDNTSWENRWKKSGKSSERTEKNKSGQEELKSRHPLKPPRNPRVYRPLLQPTVIANDGEHTSIPNDKCFPKSIAIQMRGTSSRDTNGRRTMVPRNDYANALQINNSCNRNLQSRRCSWTI